MAIRGDLYLPVNDDVQALEGVDEGGNTHMLSLHHVTPLSTFYIEARKQPSLPPQYSFGWRTDYAAKAAVELFNQASSIEGLGTTDGALTISYPGDLPNLELTAPEVPEKDLKLDEANLIRLDASQGSLVWHTNVEKGIFVKIPKMTVVTAVGIQSPWIQDIYERTASPATKVVIARNLGLLTTSVTAFLEQPFGQPTLDAI